MSRLPRRLTRLPVPILLFLWTLLVCFPRPWILGVDIWRYIRFPIDPTVAAMVPPLPRNPRVIERWVVRHVPFRWDWQNYGVPWYVPTPREVLRDRDGDCESRSFLLASLLQAKGLPFTIRASWTHMWVDYPGRPTNRAENPAVAQFGWRHGHGHLKLPSMRIWREQVATDKQGLWDVMPPLRKILLLAGWLACAVLAILRRRARRERTGQAP